MVGVHVAFHSINVFLLGTSECAVVLGVLTHPHVLPETYRTKKTLMHRQSYQYFPTCGVLLVITSSTSIIIGHDWAGHQKSIVSEQ